MGWIVDKLTKVAESKIGRWAIDTGERAGEAFVGALVMFIASNLTNAYSIDVLRAAAVSGGVAAGVVIKGALSSLFGAKGSPSLIPQQVALTMLEPAHPPGD